MQRKYTLFFICLFFTLGACAQGNPGSAPAEPKIYTYVEQMPVAGYDFNKYLSDSLHYPDSARINNIEGRVILKFIVNENGDISDAIVVRGIGGGCDEEALRVIKNMPVWKPGAQNGQPVKVLFTIPIVFKLEDPDPPVSETVSKPVVTMPVPEYDFTEFLSNNLKYPESARKRKLEGRVVVKFMVNEDGHISDCAVVRKVDDDLDAEALRIAKLLPPWKPGMKDGRAVTVWFSLPILFKLDNHDRKVTVKSVKPEFAPELKPGQPVPGYNFNSYLEENLKYPFKARKKGIEGKVMIAFTVNEDGSISDCYVKEGIGGECDEEALRVIKNMPRWRPDTEKPTKFQMVYPIVFKLSTYSKLDK
jgi:TonB family protein